MKLEIKTKKVKYQLNFPFFRIEEQFATYADISHEDDYYIRLVEKSFDKLNLRYFLNCNEFINFVIIREPFKVIFDLKEGKKKKNFEVNQQLELFDNILKYLFQ